MSIQFPPFQWGTSFAPGLDLGVEIQGESLQVVGFDPFFALREHPELHSWDLFEQYRNAPRSWSIGRTGKVSPHIAFANADTDEKLITFVRRFGPVVAKSLQVKFHESTTEDAPPPILTAEQDMAELRAEQSVYRSAHTLLSELGGDKRADIAVVRGCVSDISAKVSDWPRQWKREQELRSLHREPSTNWKFSEESLRRVQLAGRPSFGERIAGIETHVRAGHQVICELVNSFKPQVYRWVDRVIEGPDPRWDLRYGIRPLLYLILRLEYVQRVGIAVCVNNQCRKVFEIERAGQRFCAEECSRHQRQREYWAKRGKKLRKKRWKQQRAFETTARKRR